jgi:membrane-associated phospholipid phosphatase
MTSLANERPGRWSYRRWCAWVVVPLLALVLALVVQMQPSASATALSHRALFFAINQAGHSVPATAWSILTTLGDASVLFALLSPLLLVQPQALLALLAAVPLGGLFSVVLKRAFDAPRPAAVLDAAQVHVIGPVLSNHSFPSGHTISAFAAAVAVLVVLQPSARNAGSSILRFAAFFVVAVGVATAVGISRVAVGAHWPVDVLAGAACGALAGLSGAAASRRWPLLWQSARSRMWMMLGLLGAAVGLLSHPVDYPLGAPIVWLSVASVFMTALAMGARTRRY